MRHQALPDGLQSSHESENKEPSHLSCQWTFLLLGSPPRSAAALWWDDKATSAACFGTVLRSAPHTSPFEAGNTPVQSWTADVTTRIAIQWQKSDAMGKNSWPVYRTLLKLPLWDTKGCRSDWIESIWSCLHSVHIPQLFAFTYPCSRILH